MTWSQGYPISGPHRPLYHAAAGPVFADHALRLAGFDPGALALCCELGFGQGVSLAIHAACGGSWWGTDFMPSQVLHAAALAPQAQLSDQGFDEFCARTDLPVFDFVAVHGVWSWISAANRRTVLDFVRRRLRPGGVLLVSYNTAVGWASLLPIRHALQRAAASFPSGMGQARTAELALPVLQSLFEAPCVYARHNPLATEILARMHASDVTGQMLVHEFLGEHWTPFHFAELAEEMAAAKLDFACQATRLTEVAQLWLTDEQRAILDRIDDPVFRQTVQDVFTGQRHRRDYWVKGAPHLSPARAAASRAALRYVLVAAPEAIVLKPDLPRGQVVLPLAPVQPVIDALADHAPRRFDEIAAAVASADMDARSAQDALLLLMDAEAVHPAQGDAAARAATPACAQLNARIIADAGHGPKIQHLADPVTGGGMRVSLLELLLLRAEGLGHASPESQAEYAAVALGATADYVAARRFDRERRPILRLHDAA